MAGNSTRPTTPAMPSEPKWLPGNPGPQLPKCFWNQHGQRHPRPRGLAMPQEPIWPPGGPGPTDPTMPWKPTWPPASPGPTASAKPWEPKWLAAARDLQLLPCPMNQHGQPHPRAHRSHHAPGTNMAGGRPGPTAPAMPREPTWPAGALSPQLPPCPRKQHGHPAAPGPQLPPCPGKLHGSSAAL